MAKKRIPLPERIWTWITKGEFRSLNPRSRFGKRVKARFEEERHADRYRTAAQQYVRDGELEIDDDACVSISDDGGAYVQAWVWVADDEITPETEPCPTSPTA